MLDDEYPAPRANASDETEESEEPFSACCLFIAEQVPDAGFWPQ